MEYREQRVCVETAQHRITGLVTLPANSFRGGRFSDLLNSPERTFLALTDVVIEPLSGGGAPVHHEFAAVSRDHVVVATEVLDPSLADPVSEQAGRRENGIPLHR